MKFKTFMKLVFAGMLLLVAGSCYGCFSLIKRTPSSNPYTLTPLPTPDVAVSATSGPVIIGIQTTPLEKKIIGKMGTKVPQDKLQDAFPGGPRVDLSLGANGVDQAKVDLDRDGKWDEKWRATTENGEAQIKREVSSADDGQDYDRLFLLTNAGWMDLTQATASMPDNTPAPPPVAAGPGALRPFDEQIVAKAGTAISGDKVKDAIPGSVKVNLYADNGGGVNRAKLDLDRDDRFDEKWTFVNEGGKWTVKRQVAPNDDENYTEEYRLEEGRWVKK